MKKEQLQCIAPVWCKNNVFLKTSGDGDSRVLLVFLKYRFKAVLMLS